MFSRWSLLGRRATALALSLALLVAVVATGATAIPSGSVEALPDGRATRYVAISPIRVLDTRDPGFVNLTNDSALSIAPVTAEVAAAAGVSVDNVEAVAINLVVVDTLGGGYATAWSTGQPRPIVSSINNQTSGDVVPNLSIVPLGAGDMISVYTVAGADVVIDVQGVFERATSSTAGRFVPIVPSRAVDTRTTPGPGIPAGESLVVDLTGQIPADASAAVLNVAVTNTLGVGYNTVWPDQTPRPDPAANVNFPGVDYQVSNSVITGVVDGKIQVFSFGGNEVIVDVVGYMTGPSAPVDDAGLYVPLTPERHWDSRPGELPLGTSPLPADGIVSLPIAGQFSVPATGVSAITMNLTMTQTAGGGYLEAYPMDTTRPEPYASVNSNFAGQDVGNHAVVALNNGGVSLYSSGGTHAVVDVTGYFLDGTTTPPSAPPDPDPVVEPVPDPYVPASPGVPPFDDDYDYLYGTPSANAAYFRKGIRYHGWNPCEPIKYAVHAQRATQAHIDSMNTAIRQVEDASGFDFQYIGLATGSLNTTTDIDIPAGAAVVIGFSDAGATPALAGNSIGIGGYKGSTKPAHPADGEVTYLDTGGFAIADITDVEPGDELLTTFVHEISHMLGLAHVLASGEIMRPVLTPQTAFGNGDLNGLYSMSQPPCDGGGALGRSGGGSSTPGEFIDVTVVDTATGH